jgi:pimeloyl-ACP methyl ester carboxylesterase
VKPALAYLPGLEGTGELFFMQESALRDQYDVVKVPWRTEPPFDVTDLAADVASALDQAGAARATVVAESFGGVVALAFALSHAERVERLVLVNTFPYYPTRGLLRFGRALSYGPKPLVHALRVAFDSPLLRLEGIPREARRRFFAAARGQPHAAYRQRLELIAQHDVRTRLREITAPTLVVSSGRDRVVPPEMSRMLARAIPGARLHALPLAGHAALLTPGVSLADLLEDDYSLS